MKLCSFSLCCVQHVPFILACRIYHEKAEEFDLGSYLYTYVYTPYNCFPLWRKKMAEAVDTDRRCRCSHNRTIILYCHRLVVNKGHL